MILITYGTRPEWLKVKPLIAEMREENLPIKVLFTGQHKDIAPSDADYNFTMDYVINNNRLDTVIGNILKQGDIFDDPDITHVLVQGDTTSVLAIALSAFNHGKKIIHLEAGLRTYDKTSPFPEEMNRQLVSRIADIHLCPTELSKTNLLNEGVSGDIFVVGNTALDNLREFIYETPIYDDIILVTLHRRENHNKMDGWFDAINKIALKHPDLRFVFPVHPNPNVQKHRGILTAKNISDIDPINHYDLIKYINSAKLVITDSGGIQEECSFLMKKCLTCRNNTERPEAIGQSTVMVENPLKLIEVFEENISNYFVDDSCPFGDGYSSKKIINILKEIT